MSIAVGRKRICLHCRLSPGDVLTLTASIESLHLQFPQEFETDVRTPAAEIWQNNPHITPLDEKDAECIELDYPTIHASDRVLLPFLGGYTHDLGKKLGIPLELKTNRPHLYLAPEELEWVDQIREHYTHGRKIPFWLVSAGIKSDFTAKQWPIENYQEVVDVTRGMIQWVQVGADEHNHPRLDGVIDLVGKTDHRQLIRLAYHAQGGLGPVTYLQHLMAAWQKPYLCLVGGREPVPWVQYPFQHTFHTIGSLDCCRHGACWRSRVVPLGDGDSKDLSLCDQPVLGLKVPVGKCMAMIRPIEVLSVLNRICRT